MKIRELIRILQELPDQDASVVVSNGPGQDTFLVITGIVERGIRRLESNPDFAGPGREPAIEIV